MELQDIIREIDREIAQLQQARALLVEGDKPPRKAVQRKKLSAEVRKRMADAQRKRWAATKYSQ